MEFNNYILLWVCVIGLCMGSFFNVVILRSLLNESIVFPPSKCPKCNHKYVPTYQSVFFSQHFGRTRYMRCPECGKKSWQKKVISK